MSRDKILNYASGAILGVILMAVAYGTTSPFVCIFGAVVGCFSVGSILNRYFEKKAAPKKTNAAVA